MSLRVLSVAFPFAPVSADAIGGAEQVLAQLDRYLVELGHESVVIAAVGSRTRGRLVALPAIVGEWTESACAHQRERVREAIIRTLADAPFDLVHCHGLDFASYLPPAGVPVLATLHLPLAAYPADALQPSRPLTFLLPVSADQCRAAPGELHLLPPIGNGVADNPFAGRVRRRGFALALGRICPEKGFDDAVRAARAAGIELRIAGAVFPWPAHLRYAREVLAPLLDSSRRLIGPVGGRRKQWLLASACCVLVASHARETSSLAAMEALAAGTPVVAYPRGALPDLVKDGVTGYLVDDVAGMTIAIQSVGGIDSSACVRAAHQHCRLARTLAAYLALYTRLAAHAHG